MTNYDGTQNPWNLDPPPDWALRQLAVKDPNLVVLPGLSEPVYRICWRSKARLVPLVQDGEVARMCRLGVVPVTSMKSKPNWLELMQWLSDHDIWAVGDGDDAADLLDAADAKAEVDTARDQKDNLDHLATEAWFAKQLRSGEATFVRGTPSPSVPSDASRPAAPDHAE
jgi:hypothetical protein